MHGHEYGNGYCKKQYKISITGDTTTTMTWNSMGRTNAGYERLRNFAGMNLLICNVGKTAAAAAGDVVVIPFT